MKRKIVPVEPLSTYLANWKAPTSVCVVADNTVYVSGLPPFDPDTGEVVKDATVERQAELVLEQLKLCLETAGTTLENAVKCTVYCTRVDKFAAITEIYRKYFPVDPPTRTFVVVPSWPGAFDIEIECVATL